MGKFATFSKRPKAKCFSFRGASPPLLPDQGLCPWTPPQTPYCRGLSRLTLIEGLQLSNAGTARALTHWTDRFLSRDARFINLATNNCTKNPAVARKNRPYADVRMPANV